LRIALGSDHAGFALKEGIAEHLRRTAREFQDFGAFSEESVDYPDIAREVADVIRSGQFDLGILICGSGVGMSITANRQAGIRAALVSDEYTARMSRLHNDANVLVLGGRVVGIELAKSIVDVFVGTAFSGDPRHARRVKKIEGPNC
jgi:ribose 5-phosphate isomerase B